MKTPSALLLAANLIVGVYLVVSEIRRPVEPPVTQGDFGALRVLPAAAR